MILALAATLAAAVTAPAAEEYATDTLEPAADTPPTAKGAAENGTALNGLSPNIGSP